MNKVVLTSDKTLGDFYTIQKTEQKIPFKNILSQAKLIKLSSNDIVCDIGAYVGEYSLLAYRMGASKIYSY